MNFLFMNIRSKLCIEGLKKLEIGLYLFKYSILYIDINLFIVNNFIFCL